jgi:hypothetical protein
MPNAQAPDLLVNNAPVQVVPDELFPSPAQQGQWVQIAHPLGAGWVPAGAGRRVHDDESVASDSGLFGNAGVAYGWGRKDLPSRFVSLLQQNPHAPPADAGGNRRRIAAWEEYATGHKVGRTSAEPNTDQPEWTGCDCSGFVQNCLTEAKFDDGTRVIPDSVVAAIHITNSGWTQHEIAAGNFVGSYARKVDKPGTDLSTRFVRKGDVITTSAHIVFVAEDRPDTSVETFEVLNEYGDVKYWQNGAQVTPTDRFLRKSIRMPFHYWGIHLSQATVNIGKPFIWS